MDDGERQYEWEAGRRLKKLIVKSAPAEGIEDGFDEGSATMLKLEFSNGNLLANGVTDTVITAKVYRKGEEVTGEYTATAFNWTRNSGDESADEDWNAAHSGMKSITVSANELSDDIQIQCTLTGTSPAYGSVDVNDSFIASHTRGEADSNDTLSIEDGTLFVTTDDDNYRLSDNELTALYPRLNGSVSANAWVYHSQPTKTIEFKYNSAGLRVQKKVTANGKSEVTDYTLHGKLVTHMTVGNDKLHFFYDAQSRPTKVNFNGVTYTYLHNLQGDVVGIIDKSGVLVVEYKYDAWGKPLSTTGSLAGTLGIRNPFRYRGYVYDEETGVYYLRSRYYNPAVGRFTNADGLAGRRGDILSHNIYCYCDNKPILCVDLTGTGKTYVFYYYFPETTSSLKEEAMNSPYFDATDEDAVSMIPIKTAEDFINAWNAMEGEIDEVYLYLHGAAGHFLLANGRIGFDDVSEYSIDALNEKIINGTLYDFACYGAAKKGGKTVAGVLSEKTQATVIACDVGVSYRFEQDWLGWYFGNTYHARTRTMSLYQPHWFRFTYNKKKQNVRKMKLHIWRVAKGLIY